MSKKGKVSYQGSAKTFVVKILYKQHENLHDYSDRN